LMHDSKAYHAKTLYIEDIRIKENERRKGYGRRLYQKIETMASKMGLDYIQLDSEPDAVGFWHKMNFQDFDVVYYQNKTAMIKEIK
jgi:ribosomal protein S18 acetylase RimI-like enzyme